MSAPISLPRPVLVVDDDEDLRETIREVLEEHGYPVLAAVHGADALETLAEMREPPGIILLDLMMPVMDGWEMLEQLRRDEALAAIPVAVLSAGAGRAIPREACQIKTPVEFAALIALVEKHCGRASC